MKQIIKLKVGERASYKMQEVSIELDKITGIDLEPLLNMAQYEFCVYYTNEDYDRFVFCEEEEAKLALETVRNAWTDFITPIHGVIYVQKRQIIIPKIIKVIQAVDDKEINILMGDNITHVMFYENIDDLHKDLNLINKAVERYYEKR
jgi:hypothetical protein